MLKLLLTVDERNLYLEPATGAPRNARRAGRQAQSVGDHRNQGRVRAEGSRELIAEGHARTRRRFRKCACEAATLFVRGETIKGAQTQAQVSRQEGVSARGAHTVTRLWLLTRCMAPAAPGPPEKLRNTSVFSRQQVGKVFAQLQVSQVQVHGLNRAAGKWRHRRGAERRSENA